jgi:thioesterase domain-containing protein
MVPASFVILPALPRGPNGKIDRRALPMPLPESEGPSRDHDALSTIIDRRLAGVMAEVLEVPFVHLDDDFFALGGHSLSAVRLMARVQQCFGWAPPLATLYRASTPRGLAQVLADPSSRAGLQLSPLVPMQPDGKKLPIFCLHTVFPEVLCYEEIARHWDPDQPVYGIRDLRLDAPENAHESVEELASRYVEAIRAVQPQGPYRLLGWSFGGVIAYEIARQFRRDDREVSLLALVDARGHYPGEPFAREENIMWVVERALGRLSPDFVERLRSLPLEEQVDYALAEVTRAGLPPLLKAALQIFRANTEAWVRYRPSPYEGHMVLLLATETQWPDGRGPLPYWTPLVSGGITVHPLPTDHNTIVAEPYATDVADILARYL